MDKWSDMQINLSITPEILKCVSELDRFQGRLSARPAAAAERLQRIEEAVRIRSAAASCRLAGIRVTDADVAGLLRGEDPTVPDAPAIRGYAAAMTTPFGSPGRLLTSDDVRGLHARSLGREEPSPWRLQAHHREEFDADGRATGRILPTLPPRMVEPKTDELVTWLELELRTGEQHPVLVIGAFFNFFMAISPFEVANGRLARLLAGHLLERIGYRAIRYASLESEIERLRESYYESMDLAQTRIWTPDADVAPWLLFFLEVLDRHRRRVETKLELERADEAYPPLQQAILAAVREHGSVDAGLLIKATGANRNTLKDNLRRLVERGVLERTGQRRGTRYRLGTGVAVSPN